MGTTGASLRGLTASAAARTRGPVVRQPDLLYSVVPGAPGNLGAVGNAPAL